MARTLSRMLSSSCGAEQGDLRGCEGVHVRVPQGCISARRGLEGARLFGLALAVAHRQFRVDQLATRRHLKGARPALVLDDGEQDLGTKLALEEAVERSSEFVVGSSASETYLNWNLRHCAVRRRCLCCQLIVFPMCRLIARVCHVASLPSRTLAPLDGGPPRACHHSPC